MAVDLLKIVREDTLVNTKYGQLTKGQANVDLVHTAEIYLTVRSPKEVYATAKPTKIINGEAPHGSNINIPADKYHRETFFVSVHTRNLAKHVAISEQTGTSIGSHHRITNENYKINTERFCFTRSFITCSNDDYGCNFGKYHIH